MICERGMRVGVCVSRMSGDCLSDVLVIGGVGHVLLDESLGEERAVLFVDLGGGL